ncbi:MAG TPA: hypothetical protein VK172_08095 [Lentimicrobium sp.]|nr:hypothetical protein [Lentimicrobium sp.]
MTLLFVYILNDKPLNEDSEGELYFIDNHNFLDLKVIDRKQLQKEYHIKKMKWGISIKTR